MYFGVQTGYGFATSAGQANLYNSEVYPDSGGYEIMDGGYGEGLNVAVKIGRKINENINFELGINYLFGRELTTKMFSASNLGSSSQFTNEQTLTRHINGLFLAPQLVFNASTKTKLAPYAKVGVSFGCLMNVKDEVENIDIGGFAGVTTMEITQKSQGNIATGLNATLGADYILNKKMLLYAELQSLNMSYSPKKTVVTSFVINKNERIDDLSTYEKETIYLDKLTYQDVIDTEKPLETLRLTLPMSNISFNFGLKILL